MTQWDKVIIIKIKNYFECHLWHVKNTVMFIFINCKEQSQFYFSSIKKQTNNNLIFIFFFFIESHEVIWIDFTIYKIDCLLCYIVQFHSIRTLQFKFNFFSFCFFFSLFAVGFRELQNIYNLGTNKYKLEALQK